MLQQPFVLGTTMMTSLDVNHTFNRPIAQITNLLHEPQCKHFFLISILDMILILNC
jgi:hypothetical protein